MEKMNITTPQASAAKSARQLHIEKVAAHQKFNKETPGSVLPTLTSEQRQKQLDEGHISYRVYKDPTKIKAPGERFENARKELIEGLKSNFLTSESANISDEDFLGKLFKNLKQKHYTNKRQKLATSILNEFCRKKEISTKIGTLLTIMLEDMQAASSATKKNRLKPDILMKRKINIFKRHTVNNFMHALV